MRVDRLYASNGGVTQTSKQQTKSKVNKNKPESAKDTKSFRNVKKFSKKYIIYSVAPLSIKSHAKYGGGEKYGWLSHTKNMAAAGG